MTLLNICKKSGEVCNRRRRGVVVTEYLEGTVICSLHKK